MTTKEQLLEELAEAPEELLQAVLNFVMDNKQAASRAQSIAPLPSLQQPASGLQGLLDFLDTMPLSPEDIATLPKDGAENHDHYLYGGSKKSV